LLHEVLARATNSRFHTTYIAELVPFASSFSDIIAATDSGGVVVLAEVIRDAIVLFPFPMGALCCWFYGWFAFLGVQRLCLAAIIQSRDVSYNSRSVACLVDVRLVE
jgi:hypothetical protein